MVWPFVVASVVVGAVVDSVTGTEAEWFMARLTSVIRITKGTAGAGKVRVKGRYAASGAGNGIVFLNHVLVNQDGHESRCGDSDQGARDASQRGAEEKGNQHGKTWQVYA